MPRAPGFAWRGSSAVIRVRDYRWTPRTWPSSSRASTIPITLSCWCVRSPPKPAPPESSFVKTAGSRETPACWNVAGGRRRRSVDAAPPAPPQPQAAAEPPAANKAPARAQIVPIASRREMPAQEEEVRPAQLNSPAPPPLEAKLPVPQLPPAAKIAPAPPQAPPAARVSPAPQQALKVTPAPLPPPAAKSTRSEERRGG